MPDTGSGLICWHFFGSADQSHGRKTKSSSDGGGTRAAKSTEAAPRGSGRRLRDGLFGESLRSLESQTFGFGGLAADGTLLRERPVGLGAQNLFGDWVRPGHSEIPSGTTTVNGGAESFGKLQSHRGTQRTFGEAVGSESSRKGVVLRNDIQTGSSTKRVTLRNGAWKRSSGEPSGTSEELLRCGVCDLRDASDESRQEAQFSSESKRASLAGSQPFGGGGSIEVFRSTRQLGHLRMHLETSVMPGRSVILGSSAGDGPLVLRNGRTSPTARILMAASHYSGCKKSPREHRARSDGNIAAS